MAKHIIEENIKTIGGQSIVGKGNITIEGKEVKTDNKTISKNESGEIQLGAGDELAIDREYLHIKTNMIGIENQYGSMSYLTSSLLAINDVEEGTHFEIRPSNVSFYDVDRNVSHTFDIPKNTTNNSVIPVTVNGVYADEKGNITLPSNENSFSDQFLTNPEGEKFIGIDGGEAYGQIAGLALKEFAGGVAKGVVIGNQELLGDGASGIMSLFMDQEDRKTNVITTMIDESGVYSRSRQEIVSEKTVCGGGYVTEYRTNSKGGINSSELFTSSDKNKGRSGFKANFHSSTSYCSSEMTVDATEHGSFARVKADMFFVTNNTNGEVYDVFSLLEKADNSTMPVASGADVGGIKVSDTIQTRDSSVVTTTDQRTYQIQLNMDGQAVVNVPWVNTTYTNGTLVDLNTGTATINRLWRADTLSQFVTAKITEAQVDNIATIEQLQNTLSEVLIRLTALES